MEEKIEGLRSQIQEIENLLTEIEDAGSQILQRRKDRNGVLQRIQTANFRLRTYYFCFTCSSFLIHIFVLLEEKTKRLEEEENAPSVEERKAELSRRAFDLAKQTFNHANQLQGRTQSVLQFEQVLILSRTPRAPRWRRRVEEQKRASSNFKSTRISMHWKECLRLATRNFERQCRSSTLVSVQIALRKSL